MKIDAKLKQEVYDHCTTHVEGQIRLFKEAITEAQRAANQDIKSSSGDKYETNRAMMHLEIEKNQKQLLLTQKSLQVLKGIDPTKVCSKVELGSLVTTSQGHYYIAIGIGQVQVGQLECYTISPVSPIGQILMDSKVDESLNFNGRPIDVIGMV